MFDVEDFQNGITTRLLFARLDYGHYVRIDDGGDYRIANDVKSDSEAFSGPGGYADEGASSLPNRRLSRAVALCASNVFKLFIIHF